MCPYSNPFLPKKGLVEHAHENNNKKLILNPEDNKIFCTGCSNYRMQIAADSIMYTEKKSPMPGLILYEVVMEKIN